MNESTRQEDEKQARSWWQRLTGGLRRSSSALGSAISDLVSKRKLDEATLAEIEDVLIRAFALARETAKRTLGQRPFDVRRA